VRVLAHRGLRSAGPENSRRSVVAAFERAEGAEVDVLVTADGRAVLRHDERLADGTPVSSLTLAQARRILRAGDDDLPAVEDVLAAVAGRPGTLNLELKVPGAARALAPLASRLGAGVVATSFWASEVHEAARFLPGVPAGLLVSHVPVASPPAGAALLAVHEALLPAVRAAFPNAVLWAWTVDDDAAARRALGARCEVAIADDPEGLAARLSSLAP
jgi:glycerophosphoryl diester phosphodiesterase